MGNYAKSCCKILRLKKKPWEDGDNVRGPVLEVQDIVGLLYVFCTRLNVICNLMVPC